MKYTPAASPEEKLFTAHIADIAKMSIRNGRAEYSAFLNLRERELALQTASRFGVFTEVFGGYGDAERVMLRVCPYEDEEETFPIKSLDFTVKDEFDHRDVLGSILALGISREPIGDILVFDGGFRVFVSEKIADFIVSELKRVGRYPAEYAPLRSELKYEPEFASDSGTVASPRLDSVVAEITNLSRQDAVSLVEKGFVSVNHMIVQKTSHTVEENDVLSVRTKGKYKIDDLSGISRKGRVIIKYRKYT